MVRVLADLVLSTGEISDGLQYTLVTYMQTPPGSEAFYLKNLPHKTGIYKNNGLLTQMPSKFNRNIVPTALIEI